MSVYDYTGGDLCMTACKTIHTSSELEILERPVSLHIDSDGKNKEDATKS